MKILLTGSTGFIGKSITKYLGEKYDLRCLVRKRSSGVRGEIREGSLTDEKVIEKAVKGVQVIIHVAAILDANNPEIWNINVKATELLVNAAKKYKIQQFIFISTENVMHNCQDNYSKSKKAAEEAVKKFENYLILREPIVYGPGDKRYLGKVAEAIRKWPCIPLPAGGKFTLQPMYVDDIARYIEQGIKLKIKGIHLVTGAETITYKALVKKMMEITGKKKMLIPIPLCVLKIGTKLLELINITPPLTSVQLNNMLLNRGYSAQERIKQFKIKPTPLEIGLQKMLQTKYL